MDLRSDTWEWVVATATKAPRGAVGNQAIGYVLGVLDGMRVEAEKSGDRSTVHTCGDLIRRFMQRQGLSPSYLIGLRKAAERERGQRHARYRRRA
jgi:hypothetical protein